MLPDDPALNNVLFSALASCLSLAPDSPEASTLIQRAYVYPENPITPPRNRDVIYYFLTQDSTSSDLLQQQLPAVRYARPPATLSESSSAPTSDPSSAISANLPPDTLPLDILSTFAFRLHIIAYGPSSRRYAYLIRTMLYVEGHAQPRTILRQSGIIPIPHPPEPILLEEEDHSLWRKRADLTISLRVLDLHTLSRPAVTVGPNIVLHTS